MNVAVQSQLAAVSIADSRSDWLMRLRSVCSLAADRSLLGCFCWPQADLMERDNTGWLKYNWVKTAP